MRYLWPIIDWNQEKYHSKHLLFPIPFPRVIFGLTVAFIKIDKRVSYCMFLLFLRDFLCKLDFQFAHTVLYFRFYTCFYQKIYISAPVVDVFRIVHNHSCYFRTLNYAWYFKFNIICISQLLTNGEKANIIDVNKKHYWEVFHCRFVNTNPLKYLVLI